MGIKLGEKVAVETLTVELSTPTELTLSGTLSTPTAQNEFRRLLQDLHAQIVANRTASFAVNVEALSFVNSSAIRLFVDWATWLKNERGHRYTLKFLTSSRITWQKTSFAALLALMKDVLMVERVD